MKKILLFLFFGGWWFLVSAQNHLTVNGVTLGQDFRVVAESLKRSYPKSTEWDGMSKEISIYPAYLGNIPIDGAKFYSSNGRLSKCVFSEMMFEDIDGAQSINMVFNKYQQLVQQFASKYGQPYISEGKNELENYYKISSWQIGTDIITIKVDYQEGSGSGYNRIGGNASVEVQYIYGEGAYHGF